MQDVIANFQRVKDRCCLFNASLRRLREVHIPALEDRKFELESNISDWEYQKSIIELSKAFYQRAVDFLYESNLGFLQDLLNKACRFIFFDNPHMRIEVRIDNKRSRVIQFFSVDDSDPTNPIEADVMYDEGDGLKAVVGFVVQVFYILKHAKIPFLMMDEMLSQVSSAYVEPLMKFISYLAEKYGFIFILISHDERFIPYANCTYLVKDGTVAEISGSVVQVGGDSGE